MQGVRQISGKKLGGGKGDFGWAAGGQAAGQEKTQRQSQWQEEELAGQAAGQEQMRRQSQWLCCSGSDMADSHLGEETQEGDSRSMAQGPVTVQVGHGQKDWCSFRQCLGSS